MPPFAICSNERCPVFVDLYEEREGPSRLPPEKCPICYSGIFWFCPACLWPVNELPDRRNPRCSQCNRRWPFTANLEFNSSEGDNLMPYALCSNSKCEYSIELHDKANGHSIKTPTECPLCKFPMISICPQCGFLLMGNCGATDCAVCRADIRRVHMKWRARVQSA